MYNPMREVIGVRKREDSTDELHRPVRRLSRSESFDTSWLAYERRRDRRFQDMDESAHTQVGRRWSPLSGTTHNPQLVARRRSFDLHDSGTRSRGAARRRGRTPPPVQNTGCSPPIDGHSPSLCSRCLGINIESVGRKGGYEHSSPFQLTISAETCRLCLLLARIGGELLHALSGDQYRVILTFDHLLEQQLREHDHCDEETSAFIDGSYSHVWVAFAEMRPPEAARGLHDRDTVTPGSRIRPRRARTVRGRPLVCYTDEHDPARALGLTWVREPGTNTASAQSFKVAREWLRQCLASDNVRVPYEPLYPRVMHQPPTEEDHAWTFEDVASQSKPLPFSSERPARLIEVSPDPQDSGIVRLIETHDEAYEYVALSYCWGKAANRAWLTTVRSIERHLTVINLRELPILLQQSIEMVRKVDIGYVWIDALCIVQDSDTDWNIEAAKMGGIYRGSTVTVAASASESTEQGVFNERSVSTGQQRGDESVVVEATLSHGRQSRLHFKSHYPLLRDRFEDEVMRGPLAQRGWTFQEHILPKRMLFYTSSQLMWECEHCRLSEDNFPQKQRSRLFQIAEADRALRGRSIVEEWYLNVVERYSRRSLTQFGDKLVAVSALAKATFLNRSVDYLAGLWKDTLISGLAWYRVGPGNKSVVGSLPSWSWASQVSAVGYDFVYRGLQNPDGFAPRAMEAGVKPNPINPFAASESAYILLDTAIAKGVVFKDLFDSRFRREITKETFEETDALALFLDKPLGSFRTFACAIMDDESVSTMRVVVAALLTCNDLQRNAGPAIFLLLRPVNDANDEYRRVGIASTLHVDYPNPAVPALVDHWERKMVRLI